MEHNIMVRNGRGCIITTRKSGLSWIYAYAYIHDKPDFLVVIIHPLPFRTIRLRSTNTHQLQIPDKYKLHSTNIRTWSITLHITWITFHLLHILLASPSPSNNCRKRICSNNISIIIHCYYTFMFMISMIYFFEECLLRHK